MSETAIELRRAEETDLAAVERLLEANSLPLEDVRSKPECFYVGCRDGERIGIGGLEIVGEDALLRSVVVERSARGDGVGTALCEALESEARTAGVERVFLLTTTAAGFFADLGYEEIDRSDAPPSIRETREFDDLCPSSAACMRKSL